MNRIDHNLRDLFRRSPASRPILTRIAASLAILIALSMAPSARAAYQLHTVSFAPGSITSNGSILAIAQPSAGVTAGAHVAIQIGIIPCLGFALDLPEPALEGDLNGDGHVNGMDLAILLGDWGPCLPGPPGFPAMGCPADLNGSGIVNGLDLAILLGNWG
jgi:hypothetical protein